MRSLHQFVALALLAATATTLGSSSATATLAHDHADQSDETTRTPEYLALLREARSELDPTAMSNAVSDDVTTSRALRAATGLDGQATSRAFQGISDPQFDVGDPRADIVSAGIDMDSEGLTGLGMMVVESTNPNTHVSWWLYDSAAIWELDVNGDGTDDYFIAILNDGIEAFAGVLDTSTDTLACFADAFWDSASHFYGVVFPTSCVGNPPAVNWRTAMLFETFSSIYLDLAPDNDAWAGPATNSAVAPPAPTPPAAPAPDPAPAPAPAPVPSAQKCPSPVSKSSNGDDPIRTVNPTRVFDTRVGGGPQVGGSTTQIKIAGCANVPPGSASVVLNVTALDAQAPGYLSVFPCGTTVPDASNVNYTTGQTVPNTAISRLSDDGYVCVYSSADTGLLVDVTGYLPAGSDVTVRPPARFFDTRNAGGPVGGGSVTEIAVADRPGAPADTAAVILNVTALAAQAPGYLTVFPCGTTVPDASNVNYTTGQTVPNAVIARVGANGAVCVYSSAPTGLIVDAAGFVPADSPYAGINPARMHDTRVSGGMLAASSVTEVQIAGRFGIAGDAATVVLNVTALDAQAPGYLTVFPCGTSVPDASNVNYTTGQTVPNAVVAKIGAAGKVCVFTSATTGLLVDAAGNAP